MAESLYAIVAQFLLTVDTGNLIHFNHITVYGLSRE